MSTKVLITAHCYNKTEFWYNAKVRTKRLSGRGEENIKQMAVYHKQLANGTTVIYCIGADDTIKSRFRSLKHDTSSFDIFSVHLVFLERLLDCYSEESWNVREIVKILVCLELVFYDPG